MAQTQTAVSSEALSLSASVFNAEVDDWFPAGWGAKRTDAERDAEFAHALKSAAQAGESSRLGAGHPDIGKQKSRGPSLSVLEKKLGKVDRKGKGPASEETEVQEQKVESSDEEDSRAKSVGTKRKNIALDFLSGKKKTKAVANPASQKAGPSSSSEPLLRLDPPTPHPQPTEAEVPDDDTPRIPRTPPTVVPSSPGGSGDFPFSGPVALDSPQARRIMHERLARKRRTETQNSATNSPEESEEEGDDATPKKLDFEQMSKTQKRREKRRLAKLAQ